MKKQDDLNKSEKQDFIEEKNAKKSNIDNINTVKQDDSEEFNHRLFLKDFIEEYSNQIDDIIKETTLEDKDLNKDEKTDIKTDVNNK